MSMRDVDALLEAGIEEHLFTGAACGVWDRGNLLYSRYLGRTGERRDAGRIGAETLWDLASLTKPLATTLLVLRAVESGTIDLDDLVGRYLPEAAAETRDIPIHTLLTHTAGLPAVPALERFFPDPVMADPKAARARLLELRPERRWGESAVYSCTGFLLLGLILERASGLGLGALFRDEIGARLGLVSAGYRAIRCRRNGRCEGAEGAVSEIAETEFCWWRGRRLRGEVHDESAWCMGGEAGNSGLFATLGETLRLAGQFLPTGLGRDEPRLISEQSRRAATISHTDGLERRRGYGLLLHDAETHDGPAWPAETFGHTGFTGTSFFIDPGRERLVVTLTNRVYYGRASTETVFPAFRRRLHGAIAAALGGSCD